MRKADPVIPLRWNSFWLCSTNGSFGSSISNHHVGSVISIFTESSPKLGFLYQS